MKKTDEKGFSLNEVLLVTIVVILLVMVGWMVWRQTKAKTAQNSLQQSNHQAGVGKTQNSTPAANRLVLSNESVVFEAPEGWKKDGVGCVKESNMYGGQEYLDSMAVLPGEKLRTVYGDGTEYFHVNICVFKNSNNLAPKEWFEGGNGGIAEGSGSVSDETSTERINGYSTYYHKMKSSYEEVNYVIAASDKMVFIRARIYETDERLPGVGNFRKFEAPIKEMVSTITVR